MQTTHIEFELNGKHIAYEVPYKWTLLRLLREGLKMTGTKCGCDQGECGACTVQLNGMAVNSCMVMAAELNDCRVETIEGLEKNEQLHPLQTAFMALGAIQCGYCTPGMIMAAKSLLEHNPHPTREEIKDAMAGNICRCTGYEKIIDAVEAAANHTVWEECDQVMSAAK